MNTKYIINKRYIMYFVYLIILLIRLNIYMMDKMDKDIFYYLLMNKDTSLLQKYRDYFPICNNIPTICDFTIFLLIYLLYIPIICIVILIRHLKNFFNDIKLYIKHPLLLSKGMAYNAILPYITRGSELSSNTFNKIYWNKLFKKLNILTPQIYGTILNGKIKWNTSKSTKYNNKYIIKEVYGCCGKGIKLFDKNNIPQKGYYIIQEYIKTGDEQMTYRIITNFHNNKVHFLEASMLYNNSIVTNISQGGIIKNIKNIKPILKKAIEQSIIAHKKITYEYSCNTIGWDVIIKNNKIYFLEGNIGVRVDNNDYIKYVNVFYKNYV